jgi:hypothetical protein
MVENKEKIKELKQVRDGLDDLCSILSHANVEIGMLLRTNEALAKYEGNDVVDSVRDELWWLMNMVTTRADQYRKQIKELEKGD